MQPAPSHLPQRTAMWIALGGLLLLTGYLGWRIAGPYLEALLAGAALATLFFPLHLKLLRRVASPSRAALISTILLVVTVVIPFAFAVAALVEQIRQGPGELFGLLDSLATRLGLQPGDLQGRLQEAAAPLLRGSLSAATAAGGGILQFIVAIAAFHFFLLKGTWLVDEILLHSPLGPARTATLIGTVHNMVRVSFYGVVAVAAAQGLLLGVGAWIAGLPAPALWGLAAMFVSILPVIGSAIVWIPGSILLLSQGKIAMGLFFLAWSAGLVANADNVVRPLVVMSNLPVSGLLVFIALLGGIQAFGLLGIFVGPVTLAVGLALLRMLREELASQTTP